MLLILSSWAITRLNYLVLLFVSIAATSQGIQNTMLIVNFMELYHHTDSGCSPSLEVTVLQHPHSLAQFHH